MKQANDKICARCRYWSLLNFRWSEDDQGERLCVMPHGQKIGIYTSAASSCENFVRGNPLNDVSF